MEKDDGTYAMLNKGVSGLRLGSLNESERQQSQMMYWHLMTWLWTVAVNGS